MSEEKDLLVTVLDSFSTIVDILAERNDIELQLLTITDKESSLEVLEKAKAIIDNLCEQTQNLKKSFYKAFNALNPSKSAVVNEKDGNKSSDGDNINASTDEMEHAFDSELDDPLRNNENNKLENADSTDVVEDSLLNNSDVDPKNSKNSKEIDAPCENGNESEDKAVTAVSPKIKLVDINKLVAPGCKPLDVISPKPKKSVKFDSSVIILTSSDEESTKKNTSKKEKNQENSPIKSALKKSPDIVSDAVKVYTSDSDSKENYENNSRRSRRGSKKNNFVDEVKGSSSDSDSKENHNEFRKSRRITRKEKAIKERFSELVERRSKRLATEKKQKSLHTRNTSKSSESDDESDASDDELKDNLLAKKIKDKLEKANRKKSKLSSPPPPNDSSSEEEIPLSSLKSTTEGTKTSKESIDVPKKDASKKTGESEADTLNKPEDTKSKTTKKVTESSDTKEQKDKDGPLTRHKKKELLEESDLSGTSSNISDSETVKASTPYVSNGRTLRARKPPATKKIDENDLKFRSEVYISLPRFECEKLPEIYLEKKELLEIKRLRKINLRPKRTRSSTVDETPKDSEGEETPDKPENKKIKLTLKRRPQVAGEDKEEFDIDNANSGNDSDHGMDSYEVLPDGDKKNNDEDDEVLADGVVMKQSDDENPSANESDSEIENTTKKNKNKKDKNAKVDAEEEESSTKNKKKNRKKADQDDDIEMVDSDFEENKDKKKKVKKKEAEKNEDDSEEEDEKDKQKGGKKRKGRKSIKTEEKDEEENEDKDTTENEDKSDGKENSDDEKPAKKKKSTKNAAGSSESEEEFSKFCKRKDKSKQEIQRKASKRLKNKKTVIISDSDDEKSSGDKSEAKDSDEASGSDSSASSKRSEKESAPSKTKRRRIKRTKESSSDDEDKSTRKQIRRVLDRDSLSETTKQAEAAERDRKARIAEKQKKYNQLFELKKDAIAEKVVLDYDEKTEKELLCINKALVKNLKPHQVSGVKFMWDACFESLKRTKKEEGSGCILAHCMGLGKTLQVITLCHTLLTQSERTGVGKVLVVCPLNTVLNWKSEFKQWLPNEDDLDVYELVSCRLNAERQYVIKDWHENGGVLIIGYAMFRMLTNPDNKKISKKIRTTFQEGLVDPGPDLVICDEGHLLKNEKTHLSIAMNRIKTARRIVLTGTPLQNNLKEYWCMVQFIKPNLLGTYKEYLNRFVNPIINGQYTDSTPHDIQVMRRRSHVLHKLLDGVVQRRDYAVLAPYLPPKYEYVLMINLTEVQVKMYQHYMDKFARRGDGSNRTSFLFTDFQELQRICTHPRALLEKRTTREKELDDDSEGSLKDFIDDDSDTHSSSSSESKSSESGSDADSDDSRKKKKHKKPVKTRLTRAQAAQKRANGEIEEDSDVEVVPQKEWYQEYCDGEELDNLNHSGKMFLLFQILKECEQIGDKILVFSQSLITLNCIEYFLEKIDEATQAGETEKVGGHSGSWALGLDYFRLDGSSSCDNRATWCNSFNNPDNTRARLFLISTKAGGLGINLVAANRVIIFDVSWNPSHDVQSIYRVYRFGQTKPSYVYRFVAYGTMEMKIYERQVTKQAISKRVIDEQQIDRHYSQNDIQELYKIDLTPENRPTPLVPKDVLLGEMLQKYDKNIFKYHEHQSLLENKEEECLNEDERKAAWEEFENEKIIRKSTFTGGLGTLNLSGNNVANFSPQAIQVALSNIVRKDNPTWSEVQVKGIVPALVQQLQVQLSEGELTMYKRVEQEIQLMQAMHAQKLREQYYQQQMMRMIQQQQMQQKLLGNMSVNPGAFAGAKLNSSLHDYLLGRSTQSNAVAGPSRAQRSNPNEVIELN